jgi:LPXTG-motif cell wall-anchored protein
LRARLAVDSTSGVTNEAKGVDDFSGLTRNNLHQGLADTRFAPVDRQHGRQFPQTGDEDNHKVTLLGALGLSATAALAWVALADRRRQR